MVFPGGTVCRTDFECDLWTESVPLDAKFEARSRPPIYTEVMRQFRLTDTSALRLHPSVILRLCALRELFEETGLLLVENDSVPQPSANAFILCGEELRYWQDQLSHNSSSFPALYKHLLQRPPLNALSEWSNWLTPKEFVRRFDTIFYHVHLERILSRAGSIDSHVKWQSPEVDSMYVGKPAAFLHGSTDFLVPPQIYELGRLCQFVQSDQLTRFAQQRAILGCRRWCPIPIHVAIAGQRCTIYLVPGDERYEQVMRSEHTKLTAVDLVSDCHRNRLVISSGASQLWWDSSVYELGHVTPVTCAEYRIFYG
ncbi:Nucleoside diphosphate-linked moiety X motif 19 mitochondrial [Fasciola hepatica]|uniref:Nucleoside diphosphate-linked moiety X motif 19 mitochondrial n=1 Tax=Fasciola hepatica TaxID=6192 RepID=A0A4E0RAQ7_FASHE|nr:Nucleoside diphosphate-linked moiety X motif 19 mitochondrial [Fasciola hepatica]